MAQLSVERITPAVGAIICGADLGQPQSAQDVAFIRQALLDHGVNFFEGQHITTQQHWDFDRHFASPCFTIRWRWKLGDLAFWDNCAVQQFCRSRL